MSACHLYSNNNTSLINIVMLKKKKNKNKKKKKKKIKNNSKSIKTFRVGLTDRVGRVTGNEHLFFLGLKSMHSECHDDCKVVAKRTARNVLCEFVTSWILQCCIV